MKATTKVGSSKATQPQKMESLCWTCVHGIDMEYDCTQHERKFIERDRCYTVACTGHTPGAPLAALQEKRRLQEAA